MLHKKAAFPAAGHLRRGFSKQFVKSVIFFFGHIGHSFLLKIQQGQKGIPAFHGMEYFYRLSINIIIHDFQHIHAAIKSQQKVFALVFVQNIVIQRHHNGVFDVCPRTAVFECGPGILDNNRYHTLSPVILPQKRREGKVLPRVTAFTPRFSHGGTEPGGTGLWLYPFTPYSAFP
jgi:hypothetical protein